MTYNLSNNEIEKWGLEMKKDKNCKKDRITISGILKVIFFIVCFILLAIGISIIYKANKRPDKVPDIFGIKPFIVLSGSMETQIYTGDLVFVKDIDPSTIKEQDIIAFRNAENTVTTHRVVKLVNQNGKTYFTTKGDANNAEDASLVAPEAVEGIYVKRIPKIGNLMLFLQQPSGLIIVLLVILAGGMLWLYFTSKADMKKMNQEDEKYRKEFEEFKKKKEQEEHEKIHN